MPSVELVGSKEADVGGTEALGAPCQGPLCLDAGKRDPLDLACARHHPDWEGFSLRVDESLSSLVAPVADDDHDDGLDEYDNMSDGPTRNTAAIMLSFLLSFLGISCAMIIGGLLWQRLTARRREELLLAHLHRARNPINLSTKPGVWDVCIRDALSVPKLSDCAWEQLHASTCSSDAAIRLAKLHTSHPTAPRAPCHLRH